MSDTSQQLYAVAGNEPFQAHWLTEDAINTLTRTLDFCLIPMGTNGPSVAEHIAVCHNVLEKSGLKFEVGVDCFFDIPDFQFLQMHGYGTNLEGPWSEVTKAIYDCHAAVHANGVFRIATDIRIGTRTDREIVPGGGNRGKVQRVQEILERERNDA